MALSRADGWQSSVCCDAILGVDMVMIQYHNYMLIDIHSHDCKTEPDVFRFCSTSDWKSMLNTGLLPGRGIGMCAGVHPWEASLWDDTDREVLRTVLSLPHILMVGEIGLDKICKVQLERQQSIFQFQLEIAAECKKPVILHVVKAMSELLAIRKTFNTIPAWILHGFRGGPQEAAQYLSAGFYLSFGKHHNLESLQQCPSSRLFLETDEHGDIHDCYEAAAGERGIPIVELESLVEQNVRTLFPTLFGE
jgi:TatD DNase family protein